MKPEDSLSKWKHDDAKGYAEKLIQGVWSTRGD